jgi:hypothetical protein
MGTKLTPETGRSTQPQPAQLGRYGREWQGEPEEEPALSLRPSSERKWARLLKRTGAEGDQSPREASQPHNQARRPSSGRSLDKGPMTPGQAVMELEKQRRTHAKGQSETATGQDSTTKRRQPKERARSASPVKEKAEAETREALKARKGSDPTTGLYRSHTTTLDQRQRRPKSPRDAGMGSLAQVSGQSLKVDGVKELNTLLKQVFAEDEQARKGVRNIMQQVHQIQVTDAGEFNMKVLQLLTRLEGEERKALLRFTEAMELSEEEEGPGAIWISYGKALNHYSELLKRVEKKLTNSPVADTVFSFVQANSELQFS